ncbi:transmembrane protein [Diaporthe amygdali]|uniref:uncharacterized protein n=1 Tax=Phomopsis amygdali TaxID=1214568 RepID=UPI0022FDC66E|nr:uncharacterized protein J7T55_006375 [Diaporthe amygdali]KAJ0125031.1 transmembrane protein [Diaporthe amygdali]
MSALFNFQSLLLVILLLICTCAYVHDMFPSVLDRKKDGPMGVFWKCARIGERLSPYISICCVGMALDDGSKVAGGDTLVVDATANLHFRGAHETTIATSLG